MECVKTCPADLSQHAKEVQTLWAEYSRNENKRVPVTFACDEQVWLKVSGHTFREFYTLPEVHLKAQLEGKLWFCNNIFQIMGFLTRETPLENMQVCYQAGRRHGVIELAHELSQKVGVGEARY